MEERQTVAGAYAKIEAHEDLCAERYRTIYGLLRWILGILITATLGLLGWSLMEVYALQPLRQTQTVTVSSSSSGPPPTPSVVRRLP